MQRGFAAMGGGEVHLFRPWNPEAYISMSVGGDSAAGHHPLSDINDLTDQVLVHHTSEPR